MAPGSILVYQINTLACLKLTQCWMSTICHLSGRKWHRVEVRQDCAMGIYPVSYEKEYIEEEFLSSFLISYHFSSLHLRKHCTIPWLRSPPKQVTFSPRKIDAWESSYLCVTFPTILYGDRRQRVTYCYQCFQCSMKLDFLTFLGSLRIRALFV